MFRRDARRSYHRSDRLHALAFARHQQSRAIILQRSRPVHVTEHLSQTLDILDKTRFARSRLVFHPFGAELTNSRGIGWLCVSFVGVDSDSRAPFNKKITRQSPKKAAT